LSDENEAFPTHCLRHLTMTASAGRSQAVRPQAEHRRAAQWLLWLCVLGVTHGSLFPWQFHEPASYRGAVRRLVFPRDWWTSNGDVIGNVLLFVPVGVLAWLAFVDGRPAGRRALMRIVGWSLAFAILLQVLQVWLPRRSPSLSDVVWNASGLFAGLWLAERGRGVVAWLVEHWHSQHRMGYALAVGWLCLAWWPLLPLLARDTVRQALRDLLFDTVLQPAHLIVPAAGLAAIVALLGQSRWRWWLAIGLPIVALLGQFFFAQVARSPGQGWGWLLGSLVGVLAWQMPVRARAGIAAALTLAVFAFDAWRPFALAEAAQPFHFWPLEASLQEKKVLHTAALLEHLLRFAVIITTARLLGAPFLATACALAAAALGFEILQRWLPGQTADITVAVLPFVAAALVAWLWPDTDTR
jgi:VanZ family protein